MSAEDLHVQKSQRGAFIVGILLVAALAGLGGYYFSREKKENGPAGEAKQPEVALSEPGALPAGFPASLVVEKGIAIKESYSVTMPNGVVQPAIKYISAQGFVKNIAMFKDYLDKNGWQTIREGNVAEPVTFFSAKRGTESVTITLENDLKTGAVTVSIAYAKP